MRYRPAVLPPPVPRRIAPLARAERTPEMEALLDPLGAPSGSASDALATIVRNPSLFRAWAPLMGQLLVGMLPARDRELLVLRTLWRCECALGWAQHLDIALSSDISSDEIVMIEAGADHPHWHEFDAALLRAADDLHDDSIISATAWETLSTRYDEAQLIEVPVLVGHYHLVAFTLRSLGVQD